MYSLSLKIRGQRIILAEGLGDNMRDKFNEELKTLNEELLKMASLGEIAIKKAVGLMSDFNENTVKEVANLEEDMDRMGDKIQSLCLRLIIEQQPVATDLRTVSSALKMITDLERIGDQAKDIAEICKNLRGNQESFESIDLIREMAKETNKIIRKTIDAFVNKDLEAAYKIEKDDDIIDEYFVKVRDALIKRVEEKHPNPANIIDFMMIAKYLERIADHSVNISKWVIFSIEG